MLSFVFMVDFGINNHIVCPQSETACISESVVDILASENHCDQLMVVLLVLEKNTQAGTSSLCDTCLDPIETVNAEKLIRVLPAHSVRHFFIQLMNHELVLFHLQYLGSW